jgi:hypothetical protein
MTAAKEDEDDGENGESDKYDDEHDDPLPMVRPPVGWLVVGLVLQPPS